MGMIFWPASAASSAHAVPGANYPACSRASAHQDSERLRENLHDTEEPPLERKEMPPTFP